MTVDIDAAQFGNLLHAYGRSTDTPAHLAALAGADPDARRAALEHLWSAVIHQGTPWTATPPAAVVVAELLAGPLLTDAELRADLLGFLAAVAEAGWVYENLDELAPPAGFDFDSALTAALDSGDEEELYGDEIMANALYGRAVGGCRAAVPALLPAIMSALSDPEAPVRAAAAHALAACRASLTEPDAGDRLDELAAGAGSDERAALVLAMGELGLKPLAYLDDPHPGVRACAALAPGLADDEAATAEILAALRDPAATDDWFTRRPPQLGMRMRFTLVAAAIDRIEDTARLLPAALAIAAIAHRHTVDHDWGPLLRAFFADYTGGSPTDIHTGYLAALVDNPDLWDPRHGNAGLVFRGAGLPYDRDTCRALIRAGE